VPPNESRPVSNCLPHGELQRFAERIGTGTGFFRGPGSRLYNTPQLIVNKVEQIKPFQMNGMKKGIGQPSFWQPALPVEMKNEIRINARTVSSK